MAEGKVVQVIGTVVDIEFPSDELPALYNAIEIDTGGGKILLEVQNHMGNNWVRCLAMSPTDGLERGARAVAGRVSLTTTRAPRPASQRAAALPSRPRPMSNRV